MEFIVEALLMLLHFIGELLLQMVFELFAEWGLQGLREPFRRPKPMHPFFAGVCYLALGTGCGFVSLWIVPSMLIDFPATRIANLAITPVIAGLAMAAMGAWRRRRGEELIRLDRFAYGYLFALSMALVRFFQAES